MKKLEKYKNVENINNAENVKYANIYPPRGK